jgi:hypothetical protein
VDGLVQGLLIVVLGFVLTVVLAGAFVRHRVRRHLRITPAVRSSAPTSYLVSLSAAARLHRRLRRIGATARLAAALDPALTIVADDVADQALALEPQVLAAARTGRVGRPTRARLAVRIAELEEVARRLTSMATDAADRAPWDGTTRIRERLVALEAARQELTEIDLRAGLRLQR